MVAVLGMWQAGCFTFASELNRPGYGDVELEPEEIDEIVEIVARDPGGEFVGVSLRSVLELGQEREEGEGRFARRGGVELWVGRGEFEDRWMVERGWGLHGVGAVVGWLPYSSTSSTSRLYLEVDSRQVWLGRMSAGWSYQPGERIHGPQVTMGAFEVAYGRWVWDVGQGWSLMFGVSAPFYVLYGRSR